MGHCQSSQAFVESSRETDFHAPHGKNATNLKPNGSQVARNASINTTATVHSSFQSERTTLTLCVDNEISAVPTTTRSMMTHTRPSEKQRTVPLRHSSPPESSLYERNPEVLCRESSWFTLSYGIEDSVDDYDCVTTTTTATSPTDMRRLQCIKMKDESATEDPTMEGDLSQCIY